MLSAGLFTWAGTQVLLSRCLECLWWYVLCIRELGVTVWQADSSLYDKAPVPQRLSEGTGRIARSREYCSDHQTSLGKDRPKVKRRSQGKVKVQPGAKPDKVNLSYTSEKNQIHLPVQWAEGVQWKVQLGQQKRCFSHLPCFYGNWSQGYTAVCY